MTIVSHNDAKQRDARTVLSVGEERTVVILEEDVDDQGTGFTEIENIHTFVDPGKITLHFADTVRVKIVDVGENHADALAVEQLN